MFFGTSQLESPFTILLYLYNVYMLTMFMRVFRNHKVLLILLAIAIFLGSASQPVISDFSFKSNQQEKTIIKQPPFIITGSTNTSAKFERPINQSSIVKRVFPDLQSLGLSSKQISSYAYRYSIYNFCCKPNTIILSIICKLQI